MKGDFRSVRLALRSVLCAAGCLLSCVTQAGETYTPQGQALGAEIIKELVQRGYCTDAASCNKFLPRYYGHGDKVHFTCFGVTGINRPALAAVAELIVSRGIAITNGMPISLVAYSISHEEYRNRSVFKSIRPILTLEIEK